MSNGVDIMVAKTMGLLMAVVAVLLAGCNSDAIPQGDAVADDMVALTIDVVENGWQGQTVSVTRAGETIDGLKATTGDLPTGYGYGFGIFGVDLLGPTVGTQRQVTWNSTIGQWEAGEKIYWKRTSTSSTFQIFAYAPYKTVLYTTDSTTGTLTFSSVSVGSDIDLLYAAATVDRTDGRAELDFNHALAKLSFGTVTNNTGAEVTLTDIAIGGTFNTEGILNLTTGAWAWEPAATTTTPITRTPSSGLPIADKGVVSIAQDAVLLIPNAPETPATLGTIDVTVTLTFTPGGTFSFSTTLEQGKDKTYNITVEKNFEVIIE